MSLGCKALKISWALGYLEPESYCLVLSSLAGKCLVCIVHKRKTRGHNYKQSLRHERLSGTTLQIVEDGFQISLKNREVVCVQGRVEALGRVLWRCLAEHCPMLKETWEWDLWGRCGELDFPSLRRVVAVLGYLMESSRGDEAELCRGAWWRAKVRSKTGRSD